MNVGNLFMLKIPTAPKILACPPLLEIACQLLKD
jgi:hypothetical protein